jgi:hypothetical protein
MPEVVDDDFYQRADAFIDLANEQGTVAAPPLVSASLMFAAARFNAWLSATGFASGEAMRAARDARIAHFTDEYRAMLEENMDGYIQNFDTYMKPDH